MARSKNRLTRSARRDTLDIANRRLPRQEYKFNYEPASTRFRKLKDLTNVEDNRRYHPDNSARFPRGIRGQTTEIRTMRLTSPRGTAVGPSGSKRNKTWTMGFSRPMEVATCVRRQTRKEVINALRKAGKGGQRAPRHTWRSKIRCK